MQHVAFDPRRTHSTRSAREANAVRSPHPTFRFISRLFALAMGMAGVLGLSACSAEDEAAEGAEQGPEESVGVDLGQLAQALAVCTPNTRQCIGNAVRQCNASGTGFNTTSCASGTTCQAGLCVRQVCTPNSVRCVGNAVQQCNGSGTGFNSFSCSSGATCQAGQCVQQVCTPNSARCVGNAVQQCNGSGTGFSTANCAPGFTCVNGTCN